MDPHTPLFSKDGFLLLSPRRGSHCCGLALQLEGGFKGKAGRPRFHLERSAFIDFAFVIFSQVLVRRNFDNFMFFPILLVLPSDDVHYLFGAGHRRLPAGVFLRQVRIFVSYPFEFFSIEGLDEAHGVQVVLAVPGHVLKDLADDAGVLYLPALVVSVEEPPRRLAYFIEEKAFGSPSDFQVDGSQKGGQLGVRLVHGRRSKCGAGYWLGYEELLNAPAYRRLGECSSD